MLYRMSVRSNPRLLIVFVVLLGFLGLAALGFAASPVLGIAALAFTGYMGYVMVRFVRKQLRCTVEVTDEELRFGLYGEETVAVEWADITYLGVATGRRGRRTFFAYRSESDQLLAAPDEFENFDGLLEEVGGRRELERITLGDSETLKERLRAKLVEDGLEESAASKEE